MNRNPHSLITESQKKQDYNVFAKVKGKLLSFNLTNKFLTVRQVISISIDHFSEKQKCFSFDPTFYELFLAHRSGKKKHDLPALQKQQQINKTSFTHFYLQSVKQAEEMQQKQNSIKSIETEIQLKPQNKKKQIYEISRFGCFCRRK